MKVENTTLIAGPGLPLPAGASGWVKAVKDASENTGIKVMRNGEVHFGLFRYLGGQIIDGAYDFLNIKNGQATLSGDAGMQMNLFMGAPKSYISAEHFELDESCLKLIWEGLQNLQRAFPARVFLLLQDADGQIFACDAAIPITEENEVETAAKTLNILSRQVSAECAGADMTYSRTSHTGHTGNMRRVEFTIGNPTDPSFILFVEYFPEHAGSMRPSSAKIVECLASPLSEDPEAPDQVDKHHNWSWSEDKNAWYCPDDE